MIISWLIYGLIAAAATLLPLLLWSLDSSFIRSSYGEAYEPFELFGFCAALALIGVTAWRVRRHRGATPIRWLPAVLPALLLFQYLALISEYSFPAWDYRCYETAAKALLAGSDLYTDCYLYPPLLAHIMAGLSRVIPASVVGGLPAEATVWDLIFYFFQCAQFFLIGLAYVLHYRLARRLGLSSIWAALLVVGLLALNVPLLRTLRHNQVNLWVLDLLLLALLAAQTAPWLSGLAAAIGAHLKLYPAVLVLPWTLNRRWRPVLVALAGALFIVLLEADFGRDWTLWQRFLEASAAFPRSVHLRDNSLASLVHNTLAPFAAPAGIDGPTFRRISNVVLVLLSLAASVWIGRRLLRRRQVGGDQWQMEVGQTMDALALALIIAPRVWEHHYLLATPLILWAAILYGRRQPVAVGLGAFLILALPIFDIYPFSYHRLAGLLLLLWATAPSAVGEPASAATPTSGFLL